MQTKNGNRPVTKNEWDEYAEELRNIVDNPRSRILLDPNDDFGVQGGVFELGSGHLQKNFLTLWELFENTEQFDRCMEMFAKKAQSIYTTTPFSVMLTCTETGKYIMEHTHGILDVGGPEISLRYLGNFPFLGSESPETLDIRDKKVLIVTDVIVSATLVQRLADVVLEGGGTPVAALCVVMAGTLNSGSILGKVKDLPLVAYGRRGAHLPLRYLAHYPIKTSASKSVFKRKEILRIDPATGFPADRERLVKPHSAVFDRAETVMHLEKSEAIAFGLFQADQRRFTTAIRFDKLLAKMGDKIWQKIEKFCECGENGNKPPAIITTFTREDVLFRKFVGSRLGRGKSSAHFEFVAKRDSLESQDSYFLLPWTADQLRNRPVILLVASVHSAERLTHLAALLASYGVRRITAICLVNRMGTDTAAFMSRIERLASGSGASGGGQVRFNFVSVYDLADLATETLMNGATAFEAFLQGFDQITKIPSFRRWTGLMREYVKPQDVTSKRFVLGSTNKLLEPFTLRFNETIVQACTVQGKLSLLVSHAVLSRDYLPVVKELETVTDPETAYALLGLLFADVSYLKMTGNFERVREILIARLNQVRNIRFRLERNGDGVLEHEPALRQIIEGELNLLFGLAMFSYIDEKNDNGDIVVDALVCGKTPTEWRRFPANAICYFGNDRVMWTISLLLYASTHRLRGQEREQRIKERLYQRVSRFVALCDEGFPTIPTDIWSNTAWAAQQQIRVKTNFSLLIAGLSSRRKEKHELIRFLQSHLLTPPQRHSPINSALTDVGIALETQLMPSSGVSGPAVQERSQSASARLDFEGGKGQLLKVLLDEAIYTTGLLQDIATSAAELFFVTPTTRSELARYTASAQEPGFANDIVRLGDLLQQIRMDARVSKLEFREIMELRRAIFDDLWSKFSLLRGGIERYVVPLPSFIQDAIKWANQMLERIGYHAVWKFDALKSSTNSDGILAGLGSDGHKLNVLVDPQLLKEVLRNILYNARHSFRGYAPPNGKSWQDLVKLTIEFERRPSNPEMGSLDYVVIRAESLGFAPSSAALEQATENSTFAQHRLEIEEFGGILSLHVAENQMGAVVELALLNVTKLPTNEFIQKGVRK